MEEQGCRTNDYNGETQSRCRYIETVVPFDNEEGIQIHPRGFGFGPLSFYLTKDKLWATKDIDGTPDLNKFKEEVRQDVKDIGNTIKIKENSWKITNTKYPWTAIY